MQIKIEFTSSYLATLVIDGREMTVERSPGLTQLKGIRSPETENTLGGLVATRLYPKIAEFQQAWAEADEHQPNCGTWEELSEEAIEAAEDAMW